MDIFKIYKGYELYGAMNVNYLRLDSTPNYQDGWQPVLDTLGAGRFFVTTGEVLIPAFSIGDKESGETLAGKTGLSSVAVQAKLEWTYPLSHLEIASGDGDRVFRERIDLSDTKEFGSRDINLNVDLTDRTWARIEVWDIARNGAFTQPVWNPRPANR